MAMTRRPLAAKSNSVMDAGIVAMWGAGRRAFR
jgi:hypothetical protein